MVGRSASDAAARPPGWVVAQLETLWTLLRERDDWPREATALASWIYARWYCQSPVPIGDVCAPARAVQRLRAAHVHSDRFEAGWAVERLREDLGPGACEVARGSLIKVVSAVDYVVPGRPIGPHPVGAAARVTMRLDTTADGSWRTWTPGWDDEAARSKLARVYWCLPPAHFPLAVAAFTPSFDEGRPCLLKMTVVAAEYLRPDSTVLYVCSRDVPAWKPFLRHAHSELAHVLHPMTPPLARPLARGLAVAEDPDGVRSFGEDRCHHLAGAIAADLDGLNDFSRYLANVGVFFAREGLDLARPDRRPAPRGHHGG